jgi:hypothetical protein
MSVSKKYGRTWHYPFSPGTTSDDRINHHYWNDVAKINQLIHTEKLDGENNCLSKYGVYARSHAAPTTSAWTSKLRERWESIRHDLGELEIFGENLYAIHSIEYKKLDHYYYVFGIRYLDKWLSWEETKHYAALLDFPVVPELSIVKPLDKAVFENEILRLVNEPSVFDSVDTISLGTCTREGIVSRNTEEYPVDDFQHHVFKYVRKGHVKTDEHWTRNWKKANLNWNHDE